MSITAHFLRQRAVDKRSSLAMGTSSAFPGESGQFAGCAWPQALIERDRTQTERAEATTAQQVQQLLPVCRRAKRNEQEIGSFVRAAASRVISDPARS
jgi:hypothetical protein